MKIITKLVCVIAFSAMMLAACTKQENKIYFEQGTAPVLTSTSIPSVLLLTKAAKDLPALTFFWTNPNYSFTTGVSSQDVSYTIEIDTSGSNFVNPDMGQISVPKDLSAVLTVGELNTKLLSMNLQPGSNYNLKVRLKSTLNSALALYSNIITLSVTPFLDAAVTPPGTAPLYADGKLFLVGSATNGGWNNPVPVPKQEFTKIDATHYTITVSLVGGQEFLMLPKNGDWGAKYGNACGANSCNLATGDIFKAGGDNIKGPANAGIYTINVNFVSGKFTIN
jgi:hypothetical protein